MFKVQAFLKGDLVMEADGTANNLEWKQYLASENLIIDNLVLSPGLDLDNLEISIEANMDSMASKI
jgi:hypothetical protein